MPEPIQQEERGRRRVEVGVVTRDKMDKTRRVEIPRLVKHPRYGKYIRRRTICYVHDEQNQSHVGDTVEIMETRPLSKMKSWRLVRVVTRGPGHDLSSYRIAAGGFAREVKARAANLLEIRYDPDVYLP